MPWLVPVCDHATNQVIDDDRTLKAWLYSTPCLFIPLFPPQTLTHPLHERRVSPGVVHPQGSPIVLPCPGTFLTFWISGRARYDNRSPHGQCQTETLPDDPPCMR